MQRFHLMNREPEEEDGSGSIEQPQVFLAREVEIGGWHATISSTPVPPADSYLRQYLKKTLVKRVTIGCLRWGGHSQASGTTGKQCYITQTRFNILLLVA